MRRATSNSFLTRRQTLSKRIKTLDKHRLFRRHILIVVELMAVIRRNRKGLSFDLVASRGGFGAWIWKLFLPSVIIVVLGVLSLGIEQIDFDEIFGRSGTPVNHRKWEVGSWICDGSPYVDELISSFQQFFGFIWWQVSADSGFCCSWSLIDVDLLDWLSW